MSKSVPHLQRRFERYRSASMGLLGGAGVCSVGLGVASANGGVIEVSWQTLAALLAVLLVGFVVVVWAEGRLYAAILTHPDAKQSEAADDPQPDRP